jgi:hypothetical protein
MMPPRRLVPRSASGEPRAVPAGLRGMAGWLATRAVAALPSWRASLFGALLWAAAMAASAAFGLYLLRWETTLKIEEVTVLYAIGGAVAFPPALFAARFLALGRNAQVAFAAGFLAFSAATIGLTALLYAVQYRVYYAEWHGAPFSFIWALQLVFTVLAALYQFAVLGVRLYFPIGFLALFAASIWFARR